MSFKIAFIGAGSIGFTRDLLRDILSVPEFRDCEIAFTDINQKNLDLAIQLCQRDIDENGLSIKIHPTLNRREAFEGAKYIINCVRVGMMEAFRKDVEIPLKYGIDQCVGDTLCAGGIMYGQRGIPEILNFCKDIREVARPDCVMLNYANPNAMITWAANKYGGVNTIGLCHGVKNTLALICRAIEVDPKDVDYKCVGINHQTWFTLLQKDGVNLYDGLLEKMYAVPDIARDEKARLDVLKNFGYFSTESNGHLSEYLSWYRARQDDMMDWISLSAWRNGESCGYYRHCMERDNWYESEFLEWVKAGTLKYREDERSIEHGSYIIEGLETGRVYRGHFNVINHGVITNLPEDCVIEAPGYVDGTGINMPVYGDLPMGCAAICSQSVWVQRLSVEAAIRGDIRLLRQAMMMDPLTGAVLDTRMIRQLVDEMLIEEAEWLPQYTAEIELAKERMKDVSSIKQYHSPAKLKIKTIEELRENRTETMRTFNRAASKA